MDSTLSNQERWRCSGSKRLQERGVLQEFSHKVKEVKKSFNEDECLKVMIGKVESSTIITPNTGVHQASALTRLSRLSYSEQNYLLRSFECFRSDVYLGGAPFL